MSELRFDVYSVVRNRREYRVIQMQKGIPLMVAEMLAGVTTDDFVESVANEGWVGTCPQWYDFMPIVTMPEDERLGVDQLDFMLESVQQ